MTAHAFTKNQLSVIANRANCVSKQIFTARSAVLTLIALRMVTAPMPVPVAHAAGAGSVPSDDAGQPPSMMVSVALSATETGPFSIAPTTLAAAQVGTSRATDEEQAQAAAKASSKKYTSYAPVSTPVEIGSIRDYAKSLVTERFGADQWSSFDVIIQMESGWNPDAVNVSSGACGVAQVLPCSKVGTLDAVTQLNWVSNYIAARYQTPANALAFHYANHYY